MRVTHPSKNQIYQAHRLQIRKILTASNKYLAPTLTRKNRHLSPIRGPFLDHLEVDIEHQNETQRTYTKLQQHISCTSLVYDGFRYEQIDYSSVDVLKSKFISMDVRNSNVDDVLEYRIVIPQRLPSEH